MSIPMNLHQVRPLGSKRCSIKKSYNYSLCSGLYQQTDLFLSHHPFPDVHIIHLLNLLYRTEPQFRTEPEYLCVCSVWNVLLGRAGPGCTVLMTEDSSEVIIITDKLDVKLPEENSRTQAASYQNRDF